MVGSIAERGEGLGRKDTRIRIVTAVARPSEFLKVHVLTNTRTLKGRGVKGKNKKAVWGGF